MRNKSKQLFSKKERVVIHPDFTRKSDMEVVDIVTPSVLRLVSHKVVLPKSGQAMHALQPQPYDVLPPLFAFYIHCLNKHEMENVCRPPASLAMLYTLLALKLIY
jgi:hypothetical protein